MARVIPFRGIRYNPDKVSDPSRVLAPPYDIIPPEQKENLYTQSPHNIVKVDFGKDFDTDTDTDNRYTRAAGLLREWMDTDVLVREEKPSFYCYEVAYTMRGENLRFRGLMARVGLEPFEAGVVLPHEETHSKPKADRLNLLRATNANVSPIFSLYSSQEKITSRILKEVSENTDVLIQGTDGLGCTHRLWRIDGEDRISAISREMEPLRIFIADGHHRYETSLAYYQECGKPGASFVMMFLANMEESGLTVLPTHRMLPEAPADTLERLKREFHLEPVEMGPDKREFLDKMAERRDHWFGVYTREGSGYLLKVNAARATEIPGPLGQLDVTILHNIIFKKVLCTEEFVYEMDPAEAMRAVDSGKAQLALFLNPTSLHELRDVALDGRRMPPKSTYFFPKLMTGMVLNVLDG